MPHTYEEIRSVAIDILANREAVRYSPNQYQNLLLGIGEVLERRNPITATPRNSISISGRDAKIDQGDKDTILEVFWDLFRQGVITLGANDSNREFPFFRVSSYGKRIIANQDTYFFHDVTTYESLIRDEIPDIDGVTMVYLKEAMQAFRVGCILSSTVMLGVSTEHTFNLLVEKINENETHAATFQSVSSHWGILRRATEFRRVLDSQVGILPREVKEDLGTHFAGILSIIRNFRNQSGHPSGHIVGREQCYVLLQLFIPYCKKMYQLIRHYSQSE